FSCLFLLASLSLELCSLLKTLPKKNANFKLIPSLQSVFKARFRYKSPSGLEMASYSEIQQRIFLKRREFG
ncbi:hypothetical protein CEXT_716341, partial [Caerostris extrusa]